MAHWRIGKHEFEYRWMLAGRLLWRTPSRLDARDGERLFTTLRRLHLIGLIEIAHD